MERLSEAAIEIVNTLHRERLDYESEYNPLIDALNRLAAYEDAEEQGLLVRLPQKTVYSIGFGKGKNCDNLCPASIDGVGCCSLCDYGELMICEEECNQAHLPHIGKTVFLTREEAEAALKAKEE